jgi:hypothetical protein
MKNENKSRREALKLLGGTGLFLGAVPIFFASLKINPVLGSTTTGALAGTNLPREAVVEEKAVISGSGSSLAIKVTGKPGRAFYVTFALTNVTGSYRKIPGSDGVINAGGAGSVTLNTQKIPTARIYVKVITGEPNNVATLLAETEPVTISIKEGVISAFEGTVSRPIMATKLSLSSTLIAMAATQDNKILLR